ncbi:hypothetical protein TWF106_000180 [Orbilia oligospora]|uniref:Uncharacterized protein n=1 Tax=Orbilia oligospora TaxID=2813651 RepID=A0A6G1MN42_ORBOL|nr:hypothetical protein TWF788_008107 [Orbilia oligospora]KAF3221757.1 hypothetical protein TWF679_006970 [Orbilia oligospora]KAF3229667.1 hypothetical protein TWF106_000054 [Orbilia oligospora]KAF3229791.1 hypothetical protein TWF106_000180 [Orbilia oligospora]KAF3230097.1 hypothetical protein TWF191_000338 [Orbilia oligospora]
MAHAETHIISFEFPPIRACIFDMDGLLIDSEDIYTKVTDEILARYNKGRLPWSIKAQLQGRPTQQAYDLFQSWANLPLSQEDYLREVRLLQEAYFPTTQVLPGVISLLNTLRTSPSKPYIALATSSNSFSYNLKTKHLQETLFSYFAEEMIIKGDDPRIKSGRGKPAPDIYLLALDRINARREKDMLEKGASKDQILATKILPMECLVFEDSVPGVEAGRRAGMRCVWIPHDGLREQYNGQEGEVLAGLTGEGKYLDEEHESSGRTDVKEGVVLRKVDDGWGETRGSLEGFDFDRYGIRAL